MSFKTLQGRKSGGSLKSSQSHARSIKTFSPGGYLEGPSHANGGILALVDGEEYIEVEGKEYVMQRSAVEKYGVDFMHRLNKGMVSEQVRSMKKGGKVKNIKRPKRKLRNGMQARKSPVSSRRPEPRPSMTNCESDPQMYCPPPAPNYQGNWYANCCSELR
jgi:hypothetical protein